MLLQNGTFSWEFYTYHSVIEILHRSSEIRRRFIHELQFATDENFISFHIVCTEEGEQVLEEWKKLRSYVVGVSTGEATEKLGLIPIGEETGSAEKLAEFIVAGQFYYFINSYFKINFHTISNLHPIPDRSYVME